MIKGELRILFSKSQMIYGHLEFYCWNFLAKKDYWTYSDPLT
jgi:hypothetical protein